ncbi:MAG TPA: hypothetical protein VF666_12350 [Pyrinomonadaceae bacterium]|jgi:hypothetical protein
MVYYLPLIIIGTILVFLFLRFVQPELIYSVREVLVKVGMNKVLLDEEAQRPGNHNVKYYKLLIKKLQYETAGKDYNYAFDRVSKIRELYNTLSVQREELEGVNVERKPQICIAELANLLRTLSKEIVATSEYNHRTVKADAILRLIIEQTREDSPPHASPPDEYVENWFTTHPMTIEQIIEIQIAAVLGLAYRQKAENPPPTTVAGNILVTRDVAAPRADAALKRV